MKLVKIQHRDDRGEINYPLYTEEEAKDTGITYKHWTKCEEGDYGISDDGIVCQLITKKVYSSEKGKKRLYYRFPFGEKIFRESSIGRVKLEAKDRDYTLIKDGTIVYKKNPDSEHRDFATAYAVAFDPDLATALTHKNPTQKQIAWGRKFSKTETFRKMLREELKTILEDSGINERYVIDLLKESIDLAREKKDITNLLRVAENFQKMMAIDQPDKSKITNVIEATQTRRLLEKVKEEEDRLKITQTIGDVDVEVIQEEARHPSEAGSEEEPSREGTARQV